VVSVASLVFYAVGGGAFTLLLLGCIELNYIGGLLLDPTRAQSPRRRKALVIGLLSINLGVLATWKYADFASRQIHSFGHLLGLGDSPILHVALPIGISFFTFHQISYVIDVYRGTSPPQRDVLTFNTYVAMFPQLIAGPIVRYHEIADQLNRRTTRWQADLVDGFPRFCLGLTKKVVVADSVAPMVNAAFSTPGAQLNTRTAWLGVIAYTIQIYFDFSGYSDMAIGLGRMLGFQLPENFARPYSAVSITDFWRRWHMSLSRWFRDYLYIPLGGNRRGRVRTYTNLWIVFVLVGLWHGAAWTFVLWGVFHGGILVVERILKLEQPKPGAHEAFRRVITMFLVMFGWVLFRSSSLGQAGWFLHRMFWFRPGPLAAAVDSVMTNQRGIILVLACTVVAISPSFVMGRIVQFGEGRRADAARLGYALVGSSASAMLVAAGTFSPFLYFKF
jgi:alginate O-acetyltransferase complex protein AlgI